MNAPPRTPHDAAELDLPDPHFEAVAAEYESLEAHWVRAASPSERLDVVAQWDRLRRTLESWEALVHLRFNQDTRSEAARQRRARLDALGPKLTRLAVAFKRRLLDSPHRTALTEALGAQALALWEADVAAFHPDLEGPLEEEARLEAEYVALLASAAIPFDGETLPLAGIRRPATGPDRETRHRAERARWEWFAANHKALDRIFDQLVAVRTGMARRLGYPSYVPLAYRLRRRVDYGPSDVAAFREAIRQGAVPLAAQIRRKQAARLGLRRLLYWDEAVHDPTGNPEPQGDLAALLEAASSMFSALHPALARFFSEMQARNLLDLETRLGKADGGFCTGFPLWGLPFIFANFNGTKADVDVFTHESGHAFQFYRAAGLPLVDYAWPTTEACEVHSMGLEFLSWPHLEGFFGSHAERFRRNHLSDAVAFLPYAAAVDSFQHLVYEHPEASADERHEMWRTQEQIYLPWRQYRDLHYPAAGGFWQAQRHLYIHPFYYIDYGLALTCALQLWSRARTDPAGTMETYVALCDRGGSLPFQRLVRTAGITSPLEPGCVAAVLAQARHELESLGSRCSRDACAR